MDIDRHDIGRIAVVAVRAPRLDGATAPQFKGYMVDLTVSGVGRIALDLSGVDFMDSIGLASLMSSVKSMGPGGEIVLFGLNDKLRKLFAITKLDRGVFRIFPDEKEAVATLEVA